MTAATESGAPATPRKPRISFLAATILGLGYLKPGPGTWGSAVGLTLYSLLARVPPPDMGPPVIHYIIPGGAILIVVMGLAVIGTYSAHRVAGFTAKKDPQFVIIDEVSGQMLSYLLALAPPNWKYLLLGFILFRVFDIWKPFPARQAESLPGGWGIMADDWVAAIYAAAGLWIARSLGL